MYELTWQNKQTWKTHANEDGAVQAAGPDRDVQRVALMVWEEHCVECAIPECYSTCPLYVQRADQKCARFEYGIYPNPSVQGLFDHGADVRFRRWGKIEAEWTARPRMIEVADARRYARLERIATAAANRLSDLLQPVNPKRRFNGLHAFLRRQWVNQPAAPPVRPDAMYVKFMNPSQMGGNLVIEVYQGRPIFRESISFIPGWTEVVIPFDRMKIDLDKPARIFVRPSDDRELRLVFTWLDFVQFNTVAVSPATTRAPLAGYEQAKPAGKAKCVVWDLDNTLWDGIIGDDGAGGVRPRAAVIQMVRDLDDRGILQSVASKNNYDIAWKKLEELGIHEYFLYPAIHWGPKSQSLVSIAEELNINVDTFVFVDDSPFERAEVEGALPQVRVVDANALEGFLKRPEMDVPVTEAARRRRLSYLAESQRKRIAAKWGDDYEGFLRSCGMTMRLKRPTPAQHSRCLELIHRTNQLNLSARRYAAAEFAQLLASDQVECFSIECADKFGDYGLVGFVSVDVGEGLPQIRDFVLSCRVAQKGVEDAFVYWYAQRARAQRALALRAALVTTERNKPLRDTFDRLPFRIIEDRSGTKVLEMSLESAVVVPDVVTIVDEAPAIRTWTETVEAS